ncbi:hypothetical protein E3N88_15697 [Mikania micrantha]|uniref:Uncharacterized protein n=1 Tax=Mikania micrantha TaxID=192012 RepID=A0A5N6NXG9_9ASTR|nr:hypothetical protein E3N88_15697 [Mikania micrantha]
MHAVPKAHPLDVHPVPYAASYLRIQVRKVSTQWLYRALGPKCQCVTTELDLFVLASAMPRMHSKLDTRDVKTTFQDSRSPEMMMNSLLDLLVRGLRQEQDDGGGGWCSRGLPSMVFKLPRASISSTMASKDES